MKFLKELSFDYITWQFEPMFNKVKKLKQQTNIIYLMLNVVTPSCSQERRQ